MKNKSLRIAFLCDEFITEKPTEGGLGNYINRITQSLKKLGHDPEIFVISKDRKRSTTYYKNIRIEKVPAGRNILLRIILYLFRLLIRTKGPSPITHILRPLALASALEKRHLEKPFDFVQSSNCSSSGLFVRQLPERPHLIRLSSHRQLWSQVDNCTGINTQIVYWLEQKCLNRADIGYAPSQFLVDAYKKTGHDKVQVLRPPVFIETNIINNLDINLPERYLIHFGRISRRKGSDILAQALYKVWQEEPNVKMVWVGREIEKGSFKSWNNLWGNFASNVIWLGAVKKNHLYTILQKAEAAVLPSRVDNLPNTAIESLMFGIPVIATKNSSIDELVEPGLSGELVENGDYEEIAKLIIQVWKYQVPWTKTNFCRPKIMTELEPISAAQNLIKLAGFEP